jgi:hypothetical protein
MKKIVFILFILHFLSVSAQIVNIEGKRFTTDTIGWKGSYNMGFVFGKQANNYFIFNNTLHVQYKSKKSLYLILGSIDLLKTKNENVANSGFFHLRYNYKIKDWVRWEAFTQAQYNKLNGIRIRFLLGTGPRFKIVQLEKFKTYIGTLYMMEYDENTDRTQKEFQGRFSGYLSFSLRPLKTVEIVSTTYYQPRLDVNKSYRISSGNMLNFKISKIVSFGLNFQLNYDSRPPEGAVTKLTYQLENRIKVDF